MEEYSSNVGADKPESEMEPLTVLPEKKERLSEVFGMQFTLCIIILLGIFAANALSSGFSDAFIIRFARLSGGDTEEIIVKGVNAVMELLRDKV